MLFLALVLVWPAWARVVGYQMRVYACTDVRSSIVGQNPRRVFIKLLNLGQQTVILGGSMGAHVSGLTGWPLHATGLGQYVNQTHALTIEGGGQIECVVINVAPPVTVHVGVMEGYE